MLTKMQLELIKTKMEQEQITTNKLARKIRTSNGNLQKVLFGGNNHKIEYRLVLWSQDKLKFCFDRDGNTIDEKRTSLKYGERLL